MSPRSRRLVAWFLSLAALSAAQIARADEIRVIASNAVKEAFVELTPEFEKSTGHRLAVTWGGTTEIAKRIASGEPFEVVIISGPIVDELAQRGAMRAGTRRDFAESLIGAATSPGVARPDVGSAAALKKSLLEARSIVLSSGPSSVYLLELFRRMGIEDAFAPKLQRLPPGASVGEALARGEGELGFTQVSELQHMKGIVFLGALGPEVQHPTVFSIGQPASVPATGSTSQLIDYLTSPAARRAIEHSGLQPR